MIQLRTIIALLIVLSFVAKQASASEHADLFRRLDTDRDGRLTVGEVPSEHLTLFKRLVRKADANRDGMLSLAEFQQGLSSSRPEKPLAEKLPNELPGAEALLLMIVWMDRNADLSITTDEVSPELRPLFDEFVDVLAFKDRSRIPVPRLSQQALQFAARAARFAYREKIDVPLELALLSDVQWAYYQRLRTSLRPRNTMANPENAMMLLRELDTDDDGKMMADDVSEPLAERFAELLDQADRNQDKQLSEQELKNFVKRGAAISADRPALAETTQRAQQIIKRLDRNGDGRLDRQEAPPRMSQWFARLDQNSDGQLDEQEVARAVEILAALRNSAEIPPANRIRTPEPAEN
jgi:Ca2+-binding EF-hand superfamily protein